MTDREVVLSRPESSALLTDHYELTMVAAALRDGTASRDCVFEAFARRLPDGRRYGVVAGTGRLVEQIRQFRFGDSELGALAASKVVDRDTLDWLADYRFSGDIDGYREGDLYFPGSPILSVHASFAEGVILETLILSVLNHDSAIASAAARMVGAAGGRPCIEMGSRRTHEHAAVAAARAAYLVGFASSSNLQSGREFAVPTAGTAAHSFTLLHDTEIAAFRSQVDLFGPGTTLLVDTYEVMQGIRTAVEVAGTGLGAIRLDSGDLAVLAREARELLDSLGATNTRIIVTSDLDEYAIAALAAAPVDGYGVGTSLVTGSGAPTCGMVYKIVERDGVGVAKASTGKGNDAGAKRAVRRHNRSGIMIGEETAVQGVPEPREHDLDLQVPLIRSGDVREVATLEQARDYHARAIKSLPREARKLSRGSAAIDVEMHHFTS